MMDQTSKGFSLLLAVQTRSKESKDQIPVLLLYGLSDLISRGYIC